MNSAEINAQDPAEYYENQEIIEKLCDEMLNQPLGFSNSKLNHLLEYEIPKSRLKQYTNELFNAQTGIVSNRADTHTGAMGWLNKHDLKVRKRIYDKRVKKMGKCPENWIKVLAEGDSWFEYPIYLRDIISHLIRKEKHFVIKSVAAGGEWMANMLYEREYLYYLTAMRPDVFLVSGGGNDIMGEQMGALVDLKPRLLPVMNESDEMQAKNEAIYFQEYTYWVRHRMTAKANEPHFVHEDFSQFPLPDDLKAQIDTLKENEYDKVLYEKIIRGRKFLNTNFFAFMRMLQFQYMFMHKTIEAEDPAFYNSLLIITQGYDYPYPSYSRKFPFMRWLLNTVMRNGRWLKAPLQIKGILDPADQEAVMAAMIFEYNEMMIDLSSRYLNMCHIDSRGVAQHLFPNDPKKAWFDEPHVKSVVFRKIAAQYAECIKAHKTILNERGEAEKAKKQPQTGGQSQQAYSPKVFKVVNN